MEDEAVKWRKKFIIYSMLDIDITKRERKKREVKYRDVRMKENRHT